MKKTGTWKKLTALVIAALMILSAVPAVFADAPTDWDGWEDLEISLKWNDAEGNTNAASAKTIQEMPGSYWAKVPKPAARKLILAAGSLRVIVSQDSVYPAFSLVPSFFPVL